MTTLISIEQVKILHAVNDTVCASTTNTILCFADRASRYICVIKTNLMHNLSSVYIVNQLLYVSGIFVAHHQEVHCIYTTIGMCCTVQLTVCCPNSDNTHSTKKHKTYQLLYIHIYSIHPDDGLQICPKHAKVH